MAEGRHPFWVAAFVVFPDHLPTRNQLARACVYIYRYKKEVAMGRVNEEVEVENGIVLKYQHHANGRGFVAPKARVMPSSFVAASAYVEADARVGDNCTIGSGSWIDEGVILGERVFVGQNVHIGRATAVGNDVRIGSHSRIGSGVRIAGGLRIDADAKITDDSVVGTPKETDLASVIDGPLRPRTERTRSTYLTSEAA